MSRTIRIPTTFTPLEAAHLRRLAKRDHRSPAGWLHMITVERLRAEIAKEKSRGVSPGSAAFSDVLPSGLGPA